MFIIYCFIAFFVILLMPSQYESIDPLLIVVFSFVFFMLLFIYFIQRKKYINNWLRFDFVFLLGYFIVHFQSPLLYSLGLDFRVISHPWVNVEVVNYATWLSLLAIIFWLIGTSLISEKKYRLSAKVTNNVVLDQGLGPFLDKVIIIAFPLYIFVAGSVVFSGTYDGGQSWGAGAGYFYLLLTTALYLRTIVFVLSLNKDSSYIENIKKIQDNKIYIASLLFFVFLFLSIGDRGPIIRIALIFSVLYGIRVKTFSLKTVIISTCVAALLMTIVGMGRTKVVDNAVSKGIIERGYENLLSSEGLVIPTAELAGSNKILFAAIDNVPNQYPYLYGKTYMVNILSSLPVPGITKIFTELLEIPRHQTTTTHYFTYMLIGPNPTWGAGSEVVADVYVNFGLFGVPIIFFVFGMICARYSYLIEHLNESVKVSSVIIYSGLVITALSINRGMLLYPLMPIFYMLALLWLFRMLKLVVRRA